MAKIKTPRRLSVGQQAVASAAGVSPADVQTLTADADCIEIVEKGKSKGDGVWGYEAQLIGTFPAGMGDMAGQTYIKEPYGSLFTGPEGAMKAAKAARERWPSGVIDQGKAMRLFYEAFVERFNAFAGLEKKDKLGTVAVLEALVALYIVKTDDEPTDDDEDVFGAE